MPLVSAHVLGSELQAQHAQGCSHRYRAPFSRGLFWDSSLQSVWCLSVCMSGWSDFCRCKRSLCDRWVHVYRLWSMRGRLPAASDLQVTRKSASLHVQSLRSLCGKLCSASS